MMATRSGGGEHMFPPPPPDPPVQFVNSTEVLLKRPFLVDFLESENGPVVKNRWTNDIVLGKH